MPEETAASLSGEPPEPAEAAGEDLSPERFSLLVNGMLEISNLVGSVMEIDRILERIVTLTAEMFESPSCSIYLLGPRGENLTRRAAAGKTTEEARGKTLPLGRGLPGIAAKRNQTIAVEDASKDERHVAVFGASEEHQHAYICAPLRIQEQVIGVMTARRYGGRIFSAEACKLFEIICKQVAIVIEKSRMYREKVEAERLAAISISLSEVAHYIKNLQQGMQGGIYFVDLGLKRGDLDMASRGWGVLQRGTKKIASLVDNMLNYSREMRLDLQQHNINSLIYDILHQIDDSAVERGIALVPELARNVPALPLDQGRIYDALLNLIANAMDAVPPDLETGLVVVRSRVVDDGAAVEVDVQDNGVGMSDEVQGKLFNLFFSTKGEGGTGIGLSVTRKVIEAHGGTIRFVSAEGKGTTFTVRLPVRTVEAAREALAE